jgi:hypothetical protein
MLKKKLGAAKSDLGNGRISRGFNLWKSLFKSLPEGFSKDVNAPYSFQNLAKKKKKKKKISEKKKKFAKFFCFFCFFFRKFFFFR